MPLIHLQKQHHTLILVLWSPLPNTNTIRHFWEMRLNHRIDLARSEAHATRIQYTICTTEEEDLTCTRVDLDEIAMCPYLGEPGVVRVMILLAGRIAPEEDWLIGERCCGYEFAGFAVGYGTTWAGFDEAVVDFELCA